MITASRNKGMEADRLQMPIGIDGERFLCEAGGFIAGEGRAH